MNVYFTRRRDEERICDIKISKFFSISFLFFYFLPRAYSCLDIREEYFYRSMKLLLEEELIRVKFIRVKTRIINLIAL